MQETERYTKQAIQTLYELPLLDLLSQAQVIHRQHFPANQVQLATLLNIKTGGCPEDCGYCPQSAHYNTGLKREKLMPLSDVLEKAAQAKKNGASRFCMGATWRHLGKQDMDSMKDMVRGVRALGLETCMTLGMLTSDQAQELREAGLDYYNHNLDTSREFYPSITTTRTYDERLQTLQNVRDAGMSVCSGGILGMGETGEDRIGLLWQLANLSDQPESVPINKLIPVKGTPLQNRPDFDSLEFVRIIAVARIIMPRTMLRLSAGRESMSEEMQTLCFMAGANSIFYGEKLLTCKNPDENSDQQLFKKLGITPLVPLGVCQNRVEHVL